MIDGCPVEAKARLKTLAMNGDRTGIRFSGKPLHHLYFDTKFVLRGSLLYQLLAHCIDDAGSPAAQWKKKDELKVVSLGGGPGTDASGLYWVQKDLLKCGGVSCALLDYERTWKSYLQTLQSMFGEGFDLSFDHCDVTTSLSSDANS